MTDHDREDDAGAGQSRISWLLLILVALLLLAIFVERFVLVPLAVGRLLLPLLLAVAAVAGIAGTGAWSRRLMNRLLARETPSEPPGVQFDFLIGYPIFGALFFFSGWSPLPRLRSPSSWSFSSWPARPHFDSISPFGTARLSMAGSALLHL